MNSKNNDNGRRSSFRNLAIGMTLTGLSLFLVLAVGEVVCRIFFPDTQLRYVTDQQALYYFEPNQTGTVLLGNGLWSPSMHIDQLGFRGDGDKGNRRTVLLLGDSFSFGSGVRDDETFASQLNKWLGEELAVVNGGQPGYGVFQMAATLKRVGATLKPKLVIVVLWQGDLLRQPPTIDEREMYFEHRKQLALAKNSVLLTQLYRRVERALLQYGLDRFVYHVGDKVNSEKEDPSKLVERYLQGWDADVPRLLAMHQEARQYGDGIMLVLWPKEDYASEPEPGLAAQLTDRLGVFAKTHNIPFVSVQPAMRQAKPSRLLIPGDYHPTPLAHCLAAREIGKVLMGLGLATGAQGVSCSSDLLNS